MTASEHVVTIVPPAQDNSPFWKAKCETCRRYRRGWHTDVAKWAEHHRAHAEAEPQAQGAA